MSWVYWEPKSRIRIFSLWMSVDMFSPQKNVGAQHAAPDFVVHATRAQHAAPLRVPCLIAADSIIRRFLGNGHVMNMGLLEAGAGDPDKPPLFLEFRYAAAAGVAHAGPQPASQLVDVGRERAAQLDHPLDPLGNELHFALHVSLEIAVRAPFLH